MGGRSVIDSFGLYGSPLLYCNRDTEDAQPSATCILNKALPTRNGCNKFSWLVAAVSERLSGSSLLLLLHSLPKAAPAGQHLPLHLRKSLTRGIFSFQKSLVLPWLMVRYSWCTQSLGVIFMAPNFPHSIFDPLSCTGTQWIVDKVMIEHSLHSVYICDIHTVRFPLDCSPTAVRYSECAAVHIQRAVDCVLYCSRDPGGEALYCSRDPACAVLYLIRDP